MHLGDLARARFALHVRDERAEREELQPEAPRELLLDIGPEQLLDEEVELFALPPLLHVRLAEADRGVPQEAGVELRVLDDDVSGRPALDPDAGGVKYLADDRLCVII